MPESDNALLTLEPALSEPEATARGEAVTWKSWNEETYRILGVEPLSRRYPRRFDHEYRMALVSLFSVESLGVRSLYPFMREAGFDLDCIFLKEYALNSFKMPTDHERRLFIDLLRERNISLVGFSARSPYLKFLVEITEQIHRELGIPVVWGGTIGTVSPELCIRCGADYAVCNEGEETLAEFVNALALGEDPSGIPNLWFKGPNGEPKGNPTRPLLDNLDILPIQDLEDDNKFFIEFDRLTPGDPWRNTVRFESLTARGCPYRCSFCIHSMLVDLNKGKGKAVNGGSVEHTIRELEYARLKLPKMGTIFFADEVFGTGIQWVRDFKEQYLKRVGLSFDCAIEPRALNEEKIILLKESGMTELNIGIQSGSEYVRRELYDRPMGNDKLLQVVEWLHKHGIITRYDVIVDNPFESQEDKRATLDLLLQLPRPFIINMFSLNYFPGSKLTELALEKGIIQEDQVAGYTERCLSQFAVSYDWEERSNEDKVWNALYGMCSKSFIPKSFIRFLANVQWCRRHPLPVIALTRFASIVRLAMDIPKLMWQGRINLDTLRRYRGSLKSVTR